MFRNISIGAILPEQAQDFEAAKLIAAALMLVNHTTMYLANNDLVVFGYIISRAAIPIFALILVSRLVENYKKRIGALQKNLLVWGLVTQPVYWFANQHQHFNLNILLVFLIGTGLIRLHKQYGLTSPLTIPAILSVIVFSSFLEGTALLPLGMFGASLLLPYNRLAGTLFLLLMVGLNYGPDTMIASLAAIPILIASRVLASYVPRLPKIAFYVFYPATYVIALVLVFCFPHSYRWSG